VIHDIGYRRYEGARLGRAAIFRALYTHSVRAAFGLGRSARSKVLPFLLLGVMLMPAALIVAIMVVINAPSLPVPYPRYTVIMQAVIGVFVAAQAPVLFSRDLRFRTLALYFSRPMPRGDYVLAKYAAMVSAVAIVTIAPLAVLYLGTLLAKLPVGEQTKDFAVGAAGALVLSCVLAGIGAVIASLTTRRGFGVAGIISVLTLSYAGTSLAAEVIQHSDHEEVAGYLGVFSPITLVDGLQARIFGGEFSGVVPPPDTALATAVYLLATVVVVAGSVGLLLLRYRKVTGS
jgi:ABC-2 type transport system permease protein